IVIRSPTSTLNLSGAITRSSETTTDDRFAVYFRAKLAVACLGIARCFVTASGLGVPLCASDAWRSYRLRLFKTAGVPGVGRVPFGAALDRQARQARRELFRRARRQQHGHANQRPRRNAQSRGFPARFDRRETGRLAK